MNTGTTSMQGVPTTVSVSSAFLQKCMNDPEKAKYLEENLAAIPDCAKSAVNGCLGTLTNLSYMIDANGNISVAISGTNDPDGKIAKENAERKAKENREKEEKVKEKRAAKKAEEEKTAKKRAEKSAERKETGDYTLSITGNDVKSMTQSLVAKSVIISAPDRLSFDIKAQEDLIKGKYHIGALDGITKEQSGRKSVDIKLWIFILIQQKQMMFFMKK